MAGIGQYLKDTQGELRHVAWPTQAQTIIYTVLVALISVGVALYLGFFDYLLTTGLSRVIGVQPAPAAQTQQEIPAQENTQADFSLPGATTNIQ